MTTAFKMLDLFSGIGGFSYAASKFGIKPVGFAEIDPFCSKVLKKHWPDVPNYGDIKNLNWNEHVHLITGGFPCQPFSIAGKKKGSEDERYLWPEFFRIIKQAQPDWVIAENVAGIVALGLDNILLDLEAENYEATAIIIPACAANAPHRRDRLWIIANRVRQRCATGCDPIKASDLQTNKERHVKALQEKWGELQPDAWATYQAQDWFSFNARTSRADDGLSGRVDRIKALGNAIVPQVAFVLIGLIFQLETYDGA